MYADDDANGADQDHATVSGSGVDVSMKHQTRVIRIVPHQSEFLVNWGL